jgi:uncharacterized membrane protein
MNRNLIAALSFIVPIIGIIIFFMYLKKDRPLAFHALIWAMGGLTLAMVVLLAGTALLSWKGI